MAGHATLFPSQQIGQPRITDGTISWDISTDVQKDLSIPQKIHRLDRATAGAPILGLSTRLGGPKTVGNVVFYMLRTRRLRDYIPASSTFTASTTSIPFAAADLKLLQVGFYIINLNTREIMAVEAKGAAAATVERAVGTVAGTENETSADTFMILGYSGAEGDTKFFGLSQFPETIFNYNGELQDSYSLTQFAFDMAMMPGAETPQAKERLEHMDNMRMVYEKRALMDQKRKRQRNIDGKTVYTPDALDAITTENEKDFGGDMSQAALLEWAEQLSRHNTNDSIDIFCSPRFRRKVNIALAGLQTQDVEVMRRAGLNITSYNAMGFNMRFTTHPLFYDDPSTADDALNGYAYAVPFADFTPTTMKGEMTGWFRWQLNVQNRGDRLRQDQLYCNYGFQYSAVEKYGRGLNVGS